MNPGRNDPCPCGSGKKYKQCCGAMQAAAANTKTSLQELLQTGLAHHRAGRLPQAEAAYRQILQRMPDHSDALHLLGMVANQTGQNELAVELISKAIRGNPVAPMYYNLGNVFHEQGKPDAAADCFRKALELQPDHLNACLNLGVVLKAQGRLDEAAENFRKVIGLKPDLVGTYLHLGNTLKEQGKLNAAAECFQHALRLRQDYIEARVNLGNVFKEQGKLDEAIESYHKVLASKPDYAEVHNNLGNVLQAQGKLDAAVESFGKALALKPGYVEAGNNLGNVFKEQGKLDEAIACYREVLKFRPDLTWGYCNLGNVLREHGDLNAAIESFHKALTLEPDSIEAHTGMGAVLKDTGQFDAAKVHLDQVLAMEPDHPAAWASLSSLRKMTPDDLPWEEKAQRLLAGCTKLQEEMRLCYALGKYHDDVRQYEAAFGYYARANRLDKRNAPPFDRGDFSRHIDNAISANPAEAVRRPRAKGSDSRRPVFIVGMPRSGTSLTEQILASHPDVFGAGELRFWGQQADKHLSTLSSWHGDAQMLQDLAGRYEFELQRHSATALRVVDKMPGNFMHLGLIHAVFPQARILHTQRNPVDTCLSIFFQAFNNQHAYANDLEDLAFYYREYHRLMAHWRAVLPQEVLLDVPYEGVVEDQEGWSRRIIDFIGLEWDERCLNFHETERKVGTASNWQVRQKIYKTSKERWRNYEKSLGPLLDALGELAPGR